MPPFDLNAYLQRIRYSGARQPSLEALNAITEAHAQSIPFENLDVLLGRAIHLSDEAIFEKLVNKKRGGYCFEQNSLLLVALQALGFQAKALSARVRLRFTSREPAAPRTHVFVRVELGGQTYFTDVGMGSASLTGALKFSPDIVQDTPHDARRIVRAGEIYYHQVRYGENWQDACEFTLEEMPLIDREVANWYTSAHPKSHFRDRVVAARALEKGERISLENFDFTLRSRSGEAQKKKLRDGDELVDVLVNRFGIFLDAEEIEKLKESPVIGVKQC